MARDPAAARGASRTMLRVSINAALAASLDMLVSIPLRGTAIAPGTVTCCSKGRRCGLWRT